MTPHRAAGDSIGQIDIDDFHLIEPDATAVDLPTNHPCDRDRRDRDHGKRQPRQGSRQVQPRQQQIIDRTNEQQISDRQNRDRREVHQRHAGKLVESRAELTDQILVA